MTPAADEVERLPTTLRRLHLLHPDERIEYAERAAAAIEALRQQLEQARVVLGFNRTALRIAEGAFMGVSDVFPAAGAMEHANRCGAAVDMIDALSQEDAK